LDSTCRTQAKIRIRQATFAETLKVKVCLAGHEMLPFYGITDIWVLREIPQFINRDTVGHAVLIEAKTAIMRLRVRDNPVLDRFPNIGARARAVQRSRLGLDESEMPHADETAVG
jgi:hypothetical protein